MKRFHAASVGSVLAGLALTAAPAAPAAEVSIRIDPGQVVNRIDPKVYGHFFEHIYRSGNTGVWGDLIWNRSFEYQRDYWSREDDRLRYVGHEPSSRIVFGEADWQDYELQVQARKLAGPEGFLVMFGVSGGSDGFFWANLGGWDNRQHGVEYAAPGQRQAPIGDQVPGRIEEGRWYDIRVRCEGSTAVVFLDGEKVLEVEHPEGQPIAGGVGLASWATQVEYREVSVTALNGGELWSGVPAVGDDDVRLPHGWERFGEGTVQPVHGEPFEAVLNDEYAILIRNDGDALAGVEHGPLALKQGEENHGSVWAKGTAGQELVVRLVEDGQTLAEATFPAPGDDWQELAYTLTSDRDASEASLQVGLEGEGEVTIDLVTLMPQSARDNGGFRTDIYHALADLKPTAFRWPGGCYAEVYKWKRGIGPQHTRRKSLVPYWEDYDPNSLGTDEFLDLCRRLDAEPIIVVNTGMHVTGTSTPEEWAPWIKEAQEWLEYCNGPADSEWGRVRAENGHPDPYNITYWEIDNELWRSKQTDPAVYAEAVKLFSVALRGVDPSITVIAHGGNDTDNRYNEMVMDNAAEYFDILSIHHYTDPQRFREGVAAQDDLYHRLTETIRNSDNPDIEIYVSEWNAQTIDWRTGLYAGGLLNVFETHGDRLTLGGPALMVRHTSAGAWDNAFINFDHTGWFPGANYVVMKLWNEHFAPNRVALEGKTGDLNLVATTSDDGATLYLKGVNMGEEAATVKAAIEVEGEPEVAAFRLIAPGSLSAVNSMEEPDVIRPEDGEARLRGDELEFTLPPHSAGVVTLQLRR